MFVYPHQVIEKERERESHKIALQTEDSVFDEEIKVMNRQAELLVHHIAGSMSAKKRFEVMTE